MDYIKRKKDFQKVISDIRKDWRIKNRTPAADIPKAMMTHQQEMNDTATVNCGGQWCSALLENELAHFVMDDTRFKDYLKKYNATCELEKFGVYSSFGFQVRIHFKGD